MWSQVVLCLLVGFAYASNDPAWNVGEEYVYNVNGRTLAGLQISDQYSGVFIKAKVRIQPRSDGKLQALISNAQYTQVHTVLVDGWDTEIPEEELSWRPLAISSRPFQIIMENGKFVKLIVGKEITNWEANMIKSIVSLLQLNTNGENLIPGDLNSLPTEHSNSAIYEVMEDTVLGETKTTYQIRPLSDHQLLSSEKLAKFYDYKQKKQRNGDIIEIIKHEDFSVNRELPAYVFGFGDYFFGNTAASNKMGNYFTRDSTSRAMLAGSLKRHDIVYSNTVNSIHFSPTLTTEQKGVIVSFMEIELEKIKSQDEKIEEVRQPIELGNLVYTYNKPFAKTNQVQAQSSSAENDYMGRPSYDRISLQTSSSRKYGPKYFEEYTQDQPQLDEAPESPLLTYTTGYKGMSIKNAVNLVKEAEKLIKKIATELKDQEKDHYEETLDRFVNLVALLRTMNANELKQLVSQYTNKPEEVAKDPSWHVAKDSVSHMGTGPALVIIKDWIKQQVIEGEDASSVIDVMAKSVRQPTLEFMQTFFELVKSKEVVRHWPLNDTALLSFTNLARKVYIHRNISDSEYPINSFGSFCTEEGKEFIREEVMSYLEEMLNKAIRKADTAKIHSYIRAIGNLPDPRILAIYEPYLEGKEPCSQFQRLLMVLSLRKLTESYPEEASVVLFRIYQNPAEHPAVRIAAVFLLMRSRPSLQMMQVMAAYTNVDENDHVNSVVTHSIKELSELEGDDFVVLRDFAKSVRPLLADKEYGPQYGAYYVRNYVADELNSEYKFSSEIIPSEDAYLPKGLTVAVRASLNGLHRKLLVLQAVSSSIDQLIDVTYKQTQSYEDELNQQKQHAQEQLSNPFSSPNIAKILKMKPDEREQLEGSFLVELFDSARMFNFDNNTIQQLPQLIRAVEQALKGSQKLNFYKLVNLKAMALAVPTAMGVPCVITFDSPVLFRTQGDVSVSAQPALSQGGKIQTPNKVTVEGKIRITVSGKNQGRLTFITPFDEPQQYTSGFDKHWEVNTPKIKSSLQIDVQKQDLKAEIELTPENSVNLLHYRTWPYTSKSDVKDFQPISSLKSTVLIESQNMQGFKKVIGQKETGIALEVELNHERQFIDLYRLWTVFSEDHIRSAIERLWEDGNMQSSVLNVKYLPEQSTVRKISLLSSYESDYRQQSKSQDPNAYRLDDKAEPAQRQKDIMDAVAAGLVNVRIASLDTTLKLRGDRSIQYLLTGAAAKSNVDPKSRVRICFKRSSDDSELKDYETHFVLENESPNTNGLDVQYALEHEPKVDSQIALVFGNSNENLSKIKAQVKHRRSSERKQYLKDLPEYKQCKEEMKEGNNQLPACANMTVRANSLDYIQAKINYENLKPEFVDNIDMVYEAARVLLLPTLTVIDEHNPETNTINMDIKFHPDLAFFNVSVNTTNEASIARNIEVDDLVREILVAHPVYHLRSRLSGYIMGVDTYRDFCTVDKTEVSTFSNRTYPAKLSQHYTVMAQYVPKVAREQNLDEPQSVSKQLQNQLENYVVLVRQSKQSPQKEDVKIIVSTPESDAEIVEIELTPSQGAQKAKVVVNGQPIELSEQKSKDIKGGYIQAYAIPNGEVKVEVYYAFYVIYDGTRVKMVATNGKFKDAIRGLCGQFNDQDAEDFLISDNCIARKAVKFVKSYEVEGSEGQQVRQELAGDDKQCVEKDIPLYVNVITARNARRQGSDSNESDEDSGSNESYESKPSHPQRGGKQCLFHQTKYVQENGQICFTTSPLPSCRSSCRSRGNKTKTVGVHCVASTNASQLWKNQIDKENSPDFSNKQQHKTVQITVPESCSA